MKRFLYLLVPALLLGGLIAWRLNVTRQSQAEQELAVKARKTAPANVMVAPAVVRDIVHTYESVGSVESPFNVKIASQVTGLLEYLTLREGDPVTVGEVVARIDPSAIQAQVAQQQANVAEAQQRLTQAELTTNPTNVQVTTNIQQQQAALASARANYNQVSQNYQAQVAAAQSAVTDAQGRVDNATAAVNSANAAINSARATVANAQTRFDRINNLYQQGFVAAQDVDDARTQLRVAQSAVEQQRSQLASAQAAVSSASAQKSAAQQQLSIAATKGKADIEAAKEAANQSRAALAYARSNVVQRPAYQANLAALKASVSVAQAQLRNVQAQLDYTVLRSTVNGFVTARYMDPGAVATAGSPILAIVSVRQVYVTTSIPEDVSRHISPGQQAQVVIDAIPNRTFAGKITQINAAADPQSRQFTIRVTLDNPQNLIKPGMFGRVTLVTERIRNAVVVPREAIAQGKDGTTVAIVDSQSVVHRVPVKTGAQDASGIAVPEGVKAGDQVVTLSLQPVKDGQKVRIGTVNAPFAAPSGGGAATPMSQAGGSVAAPGASGGASGGGR